MQIVISLAIQRVFNGVVAWLALEQTRYPRVAPNLFVRNQKANLVPLPTLAGLSNEEHVYTKTYCSLKSGIFSLADHWTVDILSHYLQ